jgi:subtilisin family serine protease
MVAATMLVVALAAASSVFGQSSADPSSARIEAKVLDARGETTFWVVLKAKADLRSARSMRNRDAQGEFVFDELRATADRSQAGIRGLLARRGIPHKPFWIANAVRVRGDAALAAELAARPEVAEIRADRVYEVPEPTPASDPPQVNSVEWGLDRIRASLVWSTFDVRGEGIVVANIDTGVQFNHPALVAQYRGNQGGGTFDHNYNWHDPSEICGSPSLVPCDNNDHGTHTMGTIAGDDGAGNQIGVAPDVKWIAAKGCEGDTCSDSALLSSGQWILAPTDVNGENPRPDLRPHVVNNSWGGGPGDPFYQQIVNAWVAAGIFPAFANGNEGPDCTTSGSPGDYANSYSAGAFDANNSIASFSSRGASFFGGEKPNIAAPGVAVRSSIPTNSYASFSGTSMASPHLAGSVALMWSAAPELLGDIARTRAILDDAAVDTVDLACGGTADDNNVWGEGKLDAFAAVDQSPRGPTGTFAGTVTAANGGTPIANAVITVPGPITRTTTTNASGQYTMRLAPGTYSATARAPGFAAQTFSGIPIVVDTTTTRNFSLADAPNLVHDLTIVSDADADGELEPGESFALEERLRNNGRLAATGITSVLASETPGVTITQGSSSYGGIAVGGTGLNATAFAGSIAASVPCGPVRLRLDVSAAGGHTFQISLTVSVCNRILIPELGAADPYPAVFNVSGRGTSVTDVNVVFDNVTHDWPADVDILLVAPGGQKALIWSDAGSSYDIVDRDFTLDDEAGSPLPNLDRLSSGTYRPTNYGDEDDAFPAPAPSPGTNSSLTVFDGTNPNGQWRLFVYDDEEPFGEGDIENWRLVITATGAPPPPPGPPPPPPPPDPPPPPPPPDPPPPPPQPPPPGPPPPPAPPPPPPSPAARCRVPNVIGRTLAQARTLLRSRRCRVGTIRRQPSRRVGRVIRQMPRAGAVRAVGFRVNLVLGRRAT